MIPSLTKIGSPINMPFPTSERVVYDKNPLVEVICQLQYPSILKIDASPPVEFQEAIRSVFPEYKEISSMPAMPAGLPPEIANLLLSARQPKLNRHEFSTADGAWRITLASNFMALKSTAYLNRGQFREMLSQPLKALLTVYGPAYFDRIGLRFVDFLVPAHFGLEGTPWHKLVSMSLAGILADETVSSHTREFSGESQIELPEKRGKVTLRFGLADNNNTKERGFLIDSDFFTTEHQDTNAIQDTLDYFHNSAGRLFRWAISDVVHTALGPTPSN
jgi:uncharacterized protein (TIGR04255 family)